jgi:hypothetical protein
VWHLGAFKLREEGPTKLSQASEWHISLYSNCVAWYAALISTFLNPHQPFPTLMGFKTQLQQGKLNIASMSTLLTSHPNAFART